MLQGGADLQGFGNSSANSIFGNIGNNLIDGGAGADAMIGGAGNDTYFVDDAADAVIENAGHGSDAVFASINYGLSANVETLVLQGGADLGGTGNALANAIFGNSGNNTLDGQGGADILTGNAGNDTFVFNAGDRPTAIPSWTSPATGQQREIRCSSSATALARPSPTSTRPIGRSTTTLAPRTMSSRSRMPHQLMQRTSSWFKSGEQESGLIARRVAPSAGSSLRDAMHVCCVHDRVKLSSTVTWPLWASINQLKARVRERRSR